MSSYAVVVQSPARCFRRKIWRNGWDSFSAENPRRLQHATGILLRAAFRIPDSPGSINGGTGGIRTHAPFRTNGFQDRLVMTASIPFRVLPDKQDLLYRINRTLSTLFFANLHKRKTYPRRGEGTPPYGFTIPGAERFVLELDYPAPNAHEISRSASLSIPFP